MDKELLRIVIIMLGIVAMIGMVFWSSFKKRQPRRGIDFYDEEHPSENTDDFAVEPIGSALDSDLSDGPDISTDELPSLIQFSIVANDAAGFNGALLVETLQQAGLEYGSMRIFERLDDKRRVDFAVASMVEPGTFPDKNLESFYCPGIVFFLQSAEIENPLPVFNDFVHIIKRLATELNGTMCSHNRQALTDETIQKFRMKLVD